MFDASFFVAVSFFTVIGVFVYLKLPSRVLSGLDEKAAQIRNELEQAAALREEAQNVLAQYEAQRNAAEKQAEEIVIEARAAAERMAQEAKIKIEEQIARRTAQAEEKIARAEAAMVKEVRAVVTHKAIAVASEILKTELTDADRGALAETAIADLSKHFH